VAGIAGWGGKKKSPGLNGLGFLFGLDLLPKQQRLEKPGKEY